MKKYKNKFIVCVVVLAVLAGAWFYGGSYSEQGGGNSEFGDARVAHSAASYELADGSIVSDIAEPSPPSLASDTVIPSVPNSQGDEVVQDPSIPNSELRTPSSQNDAVVPDTSIPNSEFRIPNSQSDADVPNPSTPSSEPPTPNSQSDADVPDPSVPNSEFLIPNSESRPEPVEPEDATVGDGSFTVYLTVRVDSILGNMHMLNREKHELVPGDGVIFPMTSITAYEGESVFNVLQREMRRARIHMVSRFTPIYNSAYVEAINNLYEFDVGELSGWMYKVNGWFPNFGSSRYQLKPGDVIEWHYTCDLGRDLGEFWLGGVQ